MNDARERYIVGLNTPGSHVDRQRRFEQLGGRGSYPILRNPTQGSFRPMMDDKGRTFELYNSRGVVDPYPDKRKTMFDPSMLQAMNLQPYNKEPVGLMQVANNANNAVDNPIFRRIFEGYEMIEPYIPEKLNEELPGDFYGYSAPVGPGILDFGVDKDFENIYGGFKFAFEEGGIVDTPQAQETIKKKLTDEQKDYLYDFMLDFMMKERLREQQEMESRVPPFNYFDMEV